MPAGVDYMNSKAKRNKRMKTAIFKSLGITEPTEQEWKIANLFYFEGMRRAQNAVTRNKMPYNG